METILTHLKQSCAAWYSASSKRRYSNASLREEAVNCLSHYTHREVSEATGLSIRTLQLWQKSLRRDNGELSNSPQFVAVNLHNEQETSQASKAEVRLQISLPSGILIKIESISVALSATFITALNKEPSSCSI